MRARSQIPEEGQFLHVHVDLEPLGRPQDHAGELQTRVFVQELFP